MFDRDWYLRKYPDVASARVDPLIHYLTRGWQEGRNPGPEFATTAYLEANPDVATSGVNPLVHYIEFGRAEGRGIFGHRLDPYELMPKRYQFEEAAPCLSREIPHEPQAKWRRSYSIEQGDVECLRISDIAVCYSKEKADQNRLDDAASLLAEISGLAQPRRRIKDDDIASANRRLSDCWYVNDGQLRTRWASEEWPFVIRALQYDPKTGGRPRLVGEGLVSSRLDVVDIVFANPFYPLLFVFCEPDGRLLGHWLFVFPSLSRGGAHYPETIAGSIPGQPVDVAGISNDFGSNLVRVLNGETAAAVGQIAVDLDGADGRGLLFQRDFREWLSNVLRVGVVPLDPTSGRVDRFLVDGIALDASDFSKREGGTLKIHHDMLPTIAAMTEPSFGSALSQILPPLLLCGMDAASPQFRVDIPSDMPLDLQTEMLAPWPRLAPAGKKPAPGAFPPAAIRTFARRYLSEAEMLVPIAGNFGERPSERDSSSRITWLIDVADWGDSELDAAIECLAIQHGAKTDHLSLVGTLARAALSVAERSFEQVRLFPDMLSAALEAETPLVGHLGRGVLLHDPRTAHLLSKLLSNGQVETVSCPVIRVQERGRGWNKGAMKIGSLIGSSAMPHDGPDDQLLVQHFWRSAYPVVAPTSIWLARQERFGKWMAAGREFAAVQGFHVCSFEVTASSVGEPRKTARRLSVPAAAVERTTRLEMFFG